MAAGVAWYFSRHNPRLAIKVGQIKRQERVGLVRGQLDRQFVELSGRASRGHAAGGHAHLAGIKVRRVLVQHLAHVPDHSVGVKGAGAVELHAQAQLEEPIGLTLGADRTAQGHACSG